MRILLNGGVIKNVEWILKKYPQFEQYLGWLNNPRTSGDFKKWMEYKVVLPICVDNSAFSGFDEARYLRMIGKIKNEEVPISWITVPDLVGNAKITLEMFYDWSVRPELKYMPLALCAQDGLENMEVPWDSFECLFIGGTTRFKLSQHAEKLGKEALRRGKMLHMGRVNSDKRLKYAYEIGCHSVDGTSYSQYNEKYLLHALRYIEKLGKQLIMEF